MGKDQSTVSERTEEDGFIWFPRPHPFELHSWEPAGEWGVKRGLVRVKMRSRVTKGKKHRQKEGAALSESTSADMKEKLKVGQVEKEGCMNSQS